MSVHFTAIMFTALACLSLGALIQPPKWQTVRIVIGALGVLYAVILLWGAVSGSASA